MEESMMQESILDKRCKFSETLWVVSVFNSGQLGGLINAHAVLLVEGLKRIESPLAAGAFSAERFVGQYDIMAPTIGDEKEAIRISILENAPGLSGETQRWAEAVKHLLQNSQGIISTIRIFEASAYGKPYENFRAQSESYCVPRSRAEEMIREIKAQKVAIQAAWASPNPLDLLPKYQFRGHTHPLGDPLGGLNCAEWCYTQLEKAGVDKMRPKPPKSVVPSSCSVS